MTDGQHRRTNGTSPDTTTTNDGHRFWSLSATELYSMLGTGASGLSSAEARERLQRYGANTLNQRKRSNIPILVARQFMNPIVLMLLTATILSLLLGDTIDAIVICCIVLISGLLGFWQEYGAATAVEELLAIVKLTASVIRDGTTVRIPITDVVPGDVVTLSAGSGIPADCALLESTDMFVDEAVMTGETFPVEKLPAILAVDTPLADRTNALFMGTHVVSGNGKALVVETGRNTAFGAISDRLRLRPAQTDFERGIHRFGFLLMELTLLLLIAVFAINVYLAKPILDSFLFGLALAVGLTPQLLPAIISVNLSKGARVMATKKVIVKRLTAIENFGSMNILCSDKTGTLTEGTVHLHGALSVDGQPSENVLFHAALNSRLQSGFTNPIDTAICQQKVDGIDAWQRLDEVPYDFVRKRLSILASNDGRHVMVTKGAVLNILDVCTRIEQGDAVTEMTNELLDVVRKQYSTLSEQGFRTLGVAIRDMNDTQTIRKDDEAGMTFLGFLVLNDPLKEDIADTVASLLRLGVQLKMITGDNALVAKRIGAQVGLAETRILTGSDLHTLSDAALPRRALDTDIFAEIEPNQKERIVRALKQTGCVVGYMGDGINDAPALHSADVGISVQDAVDVAKDAADIVLLEPNLAVLIEGIGAGRTTFANTLKYIFMATSANFGNMFSMAGASLILPFLPLLPKQILLTNLITDLPEMTIASDRVDEYWTQQPHKWDIAFIRRFMIVFGLLSSIFDYLTFGALMLVLHAGPDEFRTGWFVESVVSAALIVLVVRTRLPFFRSRPSAPLLVTTLCVVAVTLILPYTPAGAWFSFIPLPPAFLAMMTCIVILYIGAAEFTKRLFFAKYSK